MDEKWIEEVKKTAGLLEPPESLSPEAVTDRLKKEKRKPKKKPFRAYKAAAAVLLFMLVGGGSFWIFRQLGAGDTKGNKFSEMERSRDRETFMTNDVPGEGKTAAGGYRAAASYEEIYDYLKSQEDSQENKEYEFFDEEKAEDGAVAETAASAEAEASPSEGTSHSETNTQEKGIDESDIVKTDGKYLYVIYTGEDAIGKVHIIEADGGEMKEVSCTEPVTDGIYREYDSVLELYVDGNKMILLMSCYDEEGGSYTGTAVYDITDKGNPRLEKFLSQDGEYYSSRKNGNYVYIFTRKYAAAGKKEEDRGYIPRVDGKALACENIYYPENVAVGSMLVAVSIDISSPGEIKDAKTVYCGGDTIYVSSNAIYVAEQVWSQGETKSQTELLKLSYKNGGIEVTADKRFLGGLNNQFSMDEYDGYLRLVATVYDYGTGGRTNSLYVMDENLEIVGYIHNLAEGEKIYSARFMGNTGYFVTFRQMDPLFSVDLSDPVNPKVMGELKITGFSSYLHFYDEGRLLGIGKEINPRTLASEGLKLSMFDISNPYDVKEESKLVIKNAAGSSALDNHKAVLMDTEKNMFGFCMEESEFIQDGWSFTYRYVVYSYDEEAGFTEKISVILYDSAKEEEGYASSWYINEVRGMYIGDTLYLTGAGPYIYAYSLGNGEKLGELKLAEE